MFRLSKISTTPELSFPHASGDVPCYAGCTTDAVVVFPTQVGMFRGAGLGIVNHAGFPHASGDVPTPEAREELRKKFSPRKWGCSVDFRKLARRRYVFPTQVGMFRGQPDPCSRAMRFPHASGDVPGVSEMARTLNLFSPRKWGCSGVATL